jgi:16S rRNA (cytosine967-C5)-methyltransferase
MRRPEQRQHRANPGRVAAVHVLIAVEEGQHAEQMLAELAPPPGPDRGLAWNLVLGVLRRQGALDALLGPRLSQGVSGLDPTVRAVLRAGLYDAKLTRTPPHAAVHQAVEVAKAVGAVRASRLVNAVLRRASGDPISDDPWLDLPPWLAERWKDWGPWVERLQTAPAICIAAQRPLSEDLLVAPVTLGENTLSGAYSLQGRTGRLEGLAGFEAGDWWVMDPAAVAVADLVASTLPAGGTVLDACAAPGGKSFRLHAAGFDVLAVDQDGRRMSLFTENAKRLGMDIKTRIHLWGGSQAAEIGTFDTVFVDAPCTGLGTVRRHPEIRWRCLKSDPAAMAIRQIAILKAAAEHVGPGGALVYAVCSPEAEEGTGVVTRLPGWRVESEWSSAPPTGDEDAHQAFVLRREAG